jgi:hypothetical protein
MSAKSRKEVLEQARQRYSKRGREGRSRLLDEVCELCGYERKYVIKVLSSAKATIPVWAMLAAVNRRPTQSKICSDTNRTGRSQIR